MYMYMYTPACSCCLLGVQETNVPRETLDGGGLLPLGGAEASGKSVSRAHAATVCSVSYSDVRFLLRYSYAQNLSIRVLVY